MCWVWRRGGQGGPGSGYGWVLRRGRRTRAPRPDGQGLAAAAAARRLTSGSPPQPLSSRRRGPRVSLPVGGWRAGPHRALGVRAGCGVSAGGAVQGPRVKIDLRKNGGHRRRYDQPSGRPEARPPSPGGEEQQPGGSATLRAGSPRGEHPGPQVRGWGGAGGGGRGGNGGGEPCREGRAAGWPRGKALSLAPIDPEARHLGHKRLDSERAGESRRREEGMWGGPYGAVNRPCVLSPLPDSAVKSPSRVPSPQGKPVGEKPIHQQDYKK